MEKMIYNISNGDTNWIKIVPKINTGGNVSASEELDDTLGKAISTNLKSVLSVINDNSVQFICSFRLIEPNKDEINNFFSDAFDKLSKINDPALISKKRVCLNRLNEVFSSLRKK